MADENQTIDPAPGGAQAEGGVDLDMAQQTKNQGDGPKKQRAIIVGQGFIAGGRQIIIHKITDRVRAKSKVVIEGYHLNTYDKVQLGVGQSWFNPVDFKKAYADSEPISFLIPNFNQSLKDGSPIFVRLISGSYPAANGFITKYLIYSTKTEEEEKQEQAKKEAQKSGQGKAGEGGTIGPAGIVTDAMGQVMGGIAGAFFPSKEEEKKFEPQKVASRELKSEGFNVSDEDYDASEPEIAETVETETIETETPISGTAEISTGAQVISQGATGTAQTISQGGTVSGQGTATVSQGGTVEVSGQQTVSASGTVSSGRKIGVQGTVSGQEQVGVSTAASAQGQVGVSGTISAQEKTEVSGKESMSQKVSGSGGVPAAGSGQAQATRTASQSGGVQGKIPEEGTEVSGSKQVATGSTAGVGARTDIGPSGVAGASQTASFGTNLGSSGTLGQSASTFGQISGAPISPQVGQGKTAQISSQIPKAKEIGPKEAPSEAKEISQIGEEVLPKEEIKEPASSQIETGITFKEGQPAEQIQPQTKVEIPSSEKRAAGEPEPEMEEKIEVPKEYQEMIGKMGKSGMDLARKVKGEGPKENDSSSEIGEEETGGRELSTEGQKPEEGEIGKPLEYPSKGQEPGKEGEAGEEKPERALSRPKDEGLGGTPSAMDGIQRPKEELGPKEGMAPDLGQEASEEGAGEPLTDAMPKAGLPAQGVGAPAAEAAEAGAAAAPLAEGAAAGAAGGPMGVAAGAGLALLTNEKARNELFKSAGLATTKIWYYGLGIASAVFFSGLDLFLGALIMDAYWIFGHRKDNKLFPLKKWQKAVTIFANIAPFIYIALISVLLLFVGCNYPVGKIVGSYRGSVIGGLGGSEYCEMLDSAGAGFSFGNGDSGGAGASSSWSGGSGECKVLTSGDASVNNLTSSCFGGNAAKASAIAGAESGGIPTSESKTDHCTLDNKSVSIGLFQINISVRSINGLDCKKAFSHPYDAQHKDCRVVDENLYNQCVAAAKNPIININAACQISGNGANWSAWGANRKCGF